MATANLTILDQFGDPIFTQKIPFNLGDNVQQFMETAVNLVADDKLLTFGTQFFGTFQPPPGEPLGYLINMINGIYDAPDSGLWWEFIYNGEESMKGIDMVFPEDGSNVVFQQTAATPSSSGQLATKQAFHGKLT